MPRIRRPSASLAVAFVALFVALGGVGYSAARINGKNIKNRTVTGKKLKNDTVTGKQVKESTLAKVPSAVTADSAANATTVGGIAPSGFARPVRWAFVGGAGTLIDQSGVVSVSRVGSGHYYVGFGESLGDKALTATVTTAVIGEASAGRCGGGTGGVSCPGGFNTPSFAEVLVYGWAGGSATLGDRDFYLAALPK